jgi:multiple sugar transport system ATP-binding protein
VFVAGFIDSPAMNLLAAKPSDGGVVLDGHVLPIDRATAARLNGDVTVGVRPGARLSA